MGKMQPSATLSITSKAKELKAAGRDICSMSAGEPDFDTPQAIKDACIKALEEGKIGYTPASGLPELRQAVADKFMKENNIKTSMAQCVVAPGAKFSVFTAVATLCGPGDEVILLSPYWVSYPEMVTATGAKIVVIETKAENNFEVTEEQLAAAVTENTKLLILNSPSNPCGSIYSLETLQMIAKSAIDNDYMVLSDEIYEKLVFDEKYPHISIASLSDEINERTITVNGLSKAYSMTGWRLGYLTAPLWLAKRIIAFQSHTTSNATTFAQYGALEALKGSVDDEVEAMRQAFAERSKLIYELVNDIDGLSAVKPTGAFYLFIDVSSFGLNDEEFADRLLEEYEVAAIPGAPFGAPGFIRLSYACDEATIRKAVQRLAACCDSLR
ncbi:pyridoxal phosphate-dependent aminotransferase [Lentisphaerota bacterium WC36G]|nr:pyridoxal phosphate-dependent aminotransferase [Lentisphaerae bacterium WC36]